MVWYPIDHPLTRLLPSSSQHGALLVAAGFLVKPGVPVEQRLRKPYEKDKEEEREDDEQCAEPEPVQLRKLLEVADHDFARELGLALGADAKGERHFRDRPPRDVALDEQVERDFEPV